jgi:hypothetical protein
MLSLALIVVAVCLPWILVAVVWTWACKQLVGLLAAVFG